MLMNKDLFLDGKEFISAGRASKKLGYAQDYIGELIRTEKVPGRMIGRTWYVDIQALLEHKKNRKTKNRKIEKPLIEQIVKNPENAENQEIPVFSKIEVSPKTIFVYETEDRPKLPEIKKENFFKRPNVLRDFVAVSVSIFIICAVTFSWIEALSPSVSEEIQIKITNVSDSVERTTAPIFNAVDLVKGKTANVFSAVGGFLGFVENNIIGFISDIFKNKQMVVAPENQTAEGIVVLPDGENHDATVSRVKQAFSDEVNVSVDKGGDSGVITPVFRAGDDTENYAFIMVPIKEKTQK